MTALTYLFLSSIYFFCVGLDVIMFFLQIRLILLWKNISWLIPFDNAGKPLVSAITERASGLLKTKRPLSERGKLILVLLVFFIARIILAAILKSG
jgi:hypothetical protein